MGILKAEVMLKGWVDKMENIVGVFGSCSWVDESWYTMVVVEFGR